MLIPISAKRWPLQNTSCSSATPAQTGEQRQPRLVHEGPQAEERRRHQRRQRVGERALVVVRDHERRVDRQHVERAVEVAACELRQPRGKQEHERHQHAESAERHHVGLVVEQVVDAEAHAVHDSGHERVRLVRRHQPPNRHQHARRAAPRARPSARAIRRGGARAEGRAGRRTGTRARRSRARTPRRHSPRPAPGASRARSGRRPA